MQINEIIFKRLYSGGTEVRAIAENGDVYVVENTKDILLEAINSRGYTLQRAPRQQYNRLLINS